MGFDDECAWGLLRLSLRRFNTQQEIERFFGRYCPVRSPHSPSVDIPQESSRSIDALARVLG
jgi:hypothetical protein